jgi:molybdate transport system substrate-binding protein
MSFLRAAKGIFNADKENVMTGKKIVWAGLVLVTAGALWFYLSVLRDRELSAKPILVYCAAGAKMPVLKLARDFAAETGEKIELQYGGSGTLLNDIAASRRGDLYVTSDRSYINMASGKGLIAEVLPLASHRPVVVVPKENPKDIRSLDDLLRPLLRIALGDPEAAAIGRQTRNLLFKEDLWEAFEKRMQDRGIFKPTVHEVAIAVDTGKADAGIVWDSTAAKYPDLDTVRTPAFDAAPPQIVAVAVLTSSTQPAAALRFARYLRSEAGRAVFMEYGFGAIEPDDEP